MRDIYQEVTDNLLDMVQKGPPPWQQPWKATGYSFDLPKNGTTFAYYKGINIPILEFKAQEKDYASHDWGSYAQWQEKGKQVKKGEKGTKIIFFKELTVGELEDEKKIPLIRDYSVFNACQLEGYEPEVLPEPILPLSERLIHVDQFIENTGAVILKDGGNRNYYSPGRDSIHLVSDEKWIGTADQTPLQAEYAVTFHELGHWTGAPSRCNRQFGKRFGDIEYKAEEGVAEISTAITCCALGIRTGPSQNSASYLSFWLSDILRNKKDIFTVAAEASKATDYLFSLQKGDFTGPNGHSITHPQPKERPHA